MELTELLAAARQQARERDAIRELSAERRAAKAALRSPAEREADAARMRAWEAEHAYAPSRVVFHVWRTTCNCGTVMLGRGQQLLEERHLQHKQQVRQRANPATFPDDLPKVVITSEDTCDICVHCARELGFEGDFNV